MATCTMRRPRFLELVEAAAPGEKIIYHTGSLIRDRMLGLQCIEINATACAAWDKMEAGEVAISQSCVRRADGSCEFVYHAVKLPAPHDPVKWIGCYAKDKPNSKPTMRDPVVSTMVRERRPSAARANALVDAGSLARAA